jgi:hypothetical protein
MRSITRSHNGSIKYFKYVCIELEASSGPAKMISHMHAITKEDDRHCN